MIKISLHEEIAKEIRQYMDGYVTHIRQFDARFHLFLVPNTLLHDNDFTFRVIALCLIFFLKYLII